MKLTLTDDNDTVLDQWDILSEWDIGVFAAVGAAVEGPTNILLAAAVLRAERMIPDTI